VEPVSHKRKEKSQIDKHIQLKADIVLAGLLATSRRKIRRLGLMDIPSLDELRLLIADFIKNAPATSPGEASRDARPLDIVRRGSVTVLLNWAKTPRQNRKSSPCLHWKSRGGFAKLKWRILNVPLFEGGTFEGKKSNNFKC
jgi:hypothetical protein